MVDFYRQHHFTAHKAGDLITKYIDTCIIIFFYYFFFFGIDMKAWRGRVFYIWCLTKQF